MTEFPCIYRNIARRPIELHLGQTVTILAAGAFIRVESAHPSLQRLEAAGQVSRHALPTDGMPEAVSGAQGKSPSVGPAAKPTGRTPGKDKVQQPTASRPSRPGADKGVSS